MLSNTIASPFGDFPCLHAIESKSFQSLTQKKSSTWKILQPFFVHTQNHKVKNLLHMFKINSSSFTNKNNENICSNNGSPKEKGKIGWNSIQYTTKIDGFLNLPPPLEC